MTMGKETTPGADERLRLRRGWLCFVGLQNTARLRLAPAVGCRHRSGKYSRRKYAGAQLQAWQ